MTANLKTDLREQPIAGVGAERFVRLHLRSGQLVYLHQVAENIITRVRGTLLVWKNRRSVVDDHGRLFAGGDVRYSQDEVSVTVDLTQQVFESTLARVEQS
jgi:hypothetical protein